MARAEAAHIKIEAHEDLCAERYSHIQTNITGVSHSVKELKKLMSWGGSTLFVIILGLLSFFAVRAVDNNDNQVAELKAQIAVMQQH